MSEKRERRIEFISELLTQQMNHWMLFPLTITVMGCLGAYFSVEKPDLLLWALCGLLPVFTFLIRWRTKHFLPFLLCNLCVFAISFLIPVSVYGGRGICILCGAGYLIHTFVLRLKAKDMFTSAFHPAAAIGISVFGMIFLSNVRGEEVNWNAYYIFSLTGCLSLYALIFYMNRYLAFLAVNASSSGSLPATEMFHSGMGLVLGYSLFGTVILLLCTNFSWVEKLLFTLRDALLVCLRFIFSHLFHKRQEEELLSGEPLAAGKNDEFNLPKGESALFWEILETVAVIAFVCVVVFVLLRLFLQIVRFIKERFGQQFARRTWESAESSAMDIREKCELAKRKPDAGEYRLSRFFHPGDRIRRLYKKKLINASVRLVGEERERLALLTARESEQKLGTAGMAAIYEKARYGNENISGEDVRRMKEICR